MRGFKPKLRVGVVSALLAMAICGCSSTNWRHTSPWNFPSAEEWNQPLEMSWVNAVDKFRALTAPKGKIYDPLMQNYAPDLGKALEEPENTRSGLQKNTLQKGTKNISPIGAIKS